MNETAEVRSGSLGRLLAVGGALLLLVAVFFGARIANNWGDGQPLNPNDPVSMWRQASEAEKRATAEKIVSDFRERQVLGPGTRLKLETTGSAPLVDTLIVGLDAATNRNLQEYVSPGTAMIDVAETVAVNSGWDK